MKKTLALAAAIGFLVPSLALAEGDADRGAKVFKKCKACHVVNQEKNKVGPHLFGLFGRKAGSVEGYRYSKAMIAKGEEGLVWNEETLNEFLAKPRSFVKGTKISFSGLKKEQQRLDLISYLKKAGAKSE